MVDIAFVERFPGTVSLETLKETKGLEKMMVTQKGSRLSVQPVTKPEYRHRRPPRAPEGLTPSSAILVS